jgi:hypothetical protein
VKIGRQKGGQLFSHVVDKQVGNAVGPRAQKQHQNALSERIDGDPEPEHLGVATQPRAQFIQLQMREHKVAEGALMQRLGMGSRPHQPAGDCCMSNAKDTLRCRDIQSFRLVHPAPGPRDATAF